MLPGFTGAGAGARNEPPKISLAELIADLNERFGSDLGEGDLVRNSAEAAMAEPRVQAAAFANDDLDNFGHVFDHVFEDKMYERIENDTKAMQRYADDADFSAEIKSIARRYAYESLRRNVA
jgi:type I restriction enzyme R subunit